MENKNKQAFPSEIGAWTLPQLNEGANLGLTKLEWFAAMAMQGILAGIYSDRENITTTIDKSKLPAVIANDAMVYAEATLKALES